MGLLADTDPQLRLPPDAVFADGLLAPPDEWFTEFPDWFDEVPLNKVWVDEHGRVAGMTFGPTCIIDGNEGECWIPPKSPTGYEGFHQGVQPTRSGAVLPVGSIGARAAHAPDTLGFDAAYRYYQNTGQQLMVGRAFDAEEADGVHGYFLGALVPEATVGDVAMIRRSALSCDWRWRMRDSAGNPLNAYDNVGPWLVTRPGLPLTRDGRQVMPRVRYRAMAASVGGGLDLPVGYVLEFEENPMNCSCDGPCTKCSSHAARAAAAQPDAAVEAQVDTTPAATPDVSQQVAMMELTMSDMQARVVELESLVAQLVVAGITMDEMR